MVQKCKKFLRYTTSKCNQLKQVFDNNKYNRNFANIQLDDMFTRVLRE